MLRLWSSFLGVKGDEPPSLPWAVMPTRTMPALQKAEALRALNPESRNPSAQNGPKNSTCLGRLKAADLHGAVNPAGFGGDSGLGFVGFRVWGVGKKFRVFFEDVGLI